VTTGTGREFEEMAAAAAAAARSATDTQSVPTDSPAPPSAWSEDYRSEVQQSMKAYRDMRWFAFFFIGIIAGIYLIFLFFALHSILLGGGFTEILEKVNSSNWHAIFVISIALVVFSAVPLSLLMAIVRMISEQKFDSADMKLPATEFVKICVDEARKAA